MSKFNSNKNVKYVLPIVIGIWGLFFFQLFDACNPDDVIIPQQNIGNYKPPAIKAKDTFSLLPIEKDPFLGTAYTQSKRSLNTSSSKKTNKPWPSIQYLGLVQNSNAKRKIFVININGQQQLLSQKETLHEITVIRGNEEEITLRFQGETQSFLKI